MHAAQFWLALGQHSAGVAPCRCYCYQQQTDSTTPCLLLPRYEGIVNNVVNYGCFVDIGAETNGLVHISQMADDFVTDTESIVKEGDTVKVKLVSVDLDAQKVVLTMRNSPRKAHTQQSADVSKYAAMLASDPNAFLPGTVESIVSYGAFINLEEGTSGFLHISQLTPKTEHVTDPNEVLTVGQAVQVRTDINCSLTYSSFCNATCSMLFAASLVYVHGKYECESACIFAVILTTRYCPTRPLLQCTCR
jgi:predicted RNA-binding protein with RPS1 domain